MVEASHIVQAASTVFAAKGLGATLADVAGAAGVGVASVYRRYDSKDDLILAVYADRFAAVQQLARDACEVEDPWDGIVTFFLDSVRRIATDRGFREFVLGTYRRTKGWSRSTGPDRIEALLASTQADVRAFAARLVEQAQQAGALRTDVDAADMFFLTMAVQSLLEVEAPGYPPPWERVATIVLDGLRAPVTAATDDEDLGGAIPPVTSR